MTDWSGLRKKWTEARDKAGVKKGSVSGVSLGDAIDKVAKAQAKGYTSLAKAAKDMEEAADKYKAKIAKANPATAKWIADHISKEASALSKGVALDIGNLKWIIANLVNSGEVSGEWIFPDEGKLQNVMALMKTDPALTFAEATKRLNMFYAVEKFGPLVAKRAIDMKALTWHAKLPGHDADYTDLGEFADAVLSDVKLVLQWSKAASLDEFGTFGRTLRSKRTVRDLRLYAQKSIKALLG